MPGITIEDEDQQGVLIPLAAILDVLGERALNSNWVLCDVDALGDRSARELHRLADQHEPVSGRQLRELLTQTWQIVDGKFTALEPGERVPWVAIHAVDSSAYDVLTDVEDVLCRLRSNFRSVSDLPVSAYTWPPNVPPSG